MDIGGGDIPKPGFVNVDMIPQADVCFDLETLSDGNKLPFDDDSVSEVYSSHCFEHIKGLVALIREVSRICRVGAIVEIRVPSWLSSMANCHGHIQTIGPEQIVHWTESAIPYWYGESEKILRLVSAEHVKGGYFDRWKRILPQASDQDILEMCPNACHEVRYKFEVVNRF